ncbi:type II toxin-antitoxin system PemK/MazF family toxin [Pseudoroseomonas cervicalis]|uniref:type II toxin-antitoxin system PemK/MazF family toxin n=1 Tax=Teichococcus cervicalis TaxID=204525 RepID=UPI0022F16B8D|nr:type II toxin-antitoxin system PemK/MazF family toxin [Pseudoroseomonas cervicalis]WBV43520.1 type II toxin-antitoxin system PemK/MazF family toxin [Pseudoroseomonas cervicalis]
MRRGDIVLIADHSGGDYGSKPRPAVVVQSELFEGTGSVTVCLLTTQLTGAPLLRVPVAPGEGSGLRVPSRIAIEKL